MYLISQNNPKTYSAWDTTEIISRLAVLTPPQNPRFGGGSAHLFKSVNFDRMTVL